MPTRLNRTAVAALFVLLSCLLPGARLRSQASQMQASAAGTIQANPKDGLKYVWIPPGTFQMGCSPGDDVCLSDEKPPHQVTISKGFWMGQTLVTVGAYKRFAAATGKAMPTAPSFNSGWADEAMPIVNVEWDDAQAYCSWAGGRLPTDAEYEYAARAGSTEQYYGPIDQIAWYENNSEGRTHEVGQKKPNGFGLFDMLGNAWEWVNDWFDGDYYKNSPSQDPPGPAKGQNRVIRGGSWWDSRRNYLRLSYRTWFPPGYKDVIGFRCVANSMNP